MSRGNQSEFSRAMEEKSNMSGRNSANSGRGQQKRSLVMAGDNMIHGAANAVSPQMQQQQMQMNTVDPMKMTNKSEVETASQMERISARMSEARDSQQESNSKMQQQQLQGQDSQSNYSQAMRMDSQNFFKMSGMPKFGKQWLDNFIEDPDLQNTFITSEVVRNVLMLQCVFYASVYNDLLLYKQAFLLQKEGQETESELHKIQQKSQDLMKDLPPFKIGIIGCGHVGTMILTKLLEIQNSFNNLKVIVSTRQPHLLGAFQQEFCVEASYNNERVVRECDIIFMCVLPSQAIEVFKEIRLVTEERFVMAAKDKSKSRPLFISCLAATGFNKLRLMLTKDTNFLRTPVKVSVIREYLNRTKNAVPDQALHPAQNIAQTQKEIHNHVLVDQETGQTLAQAEEENVETASEKRKQERVLLPGDEKIAKAKEAALQKVLFEKALKIGKETGVTAEFIVQQTSEQLAYQLEDLFRLFDTFQEVLYANDPAIVQTGDESSKNSRSQKSKSRPVSRKERPPSGSQPAEGQTEQSSSQGENRVMYEESILMTMLGPDYIQYISEETGEWTDEQMVLQRFQELFETRIRYIFDAEEDIEGQSQYDQ